MFSLVLKHILRNDLHCMEWLFYTQRLPPVTYRCSCHFHKQVSRTEHRCLTWVALSYFGINSRGLNVDLKTSTNLVCRSPFLERSGYLCTSNSDCRLCWNCGKHVGDASFFCEFCNCLQPANKRENYFQVLGLNRLYTVDISDLKKKYRMLQTLLHPDKFSSKPKKEQEFSEEVSAVVNKAYSTLLNPLERGLYMLSLHDIFIEEGTVQVDKMFLIEIMERNEEIENESNPKKLKDYYTINKKQLESLIGEVAEAFSSNDVELAKKLLTKMKYYNNIENKIKEIKQKLNIPD